MDKIRIRDKKRIALVLSGGAVKAACFHIGVGLALEKNGFTFRSGLKQDESPPAAEKEVTVFVGSSAGSLIASLVASGYSFRDIYDTFAHNSRHTSLRKIRYTDMFHMNPLDILRYYQRIFTSFKVRQQSMESLAQQMVGITGLFSTARLARLLRDEVLSTNDFKALEPELYIVASLLDYPGKVHFGPKYSDEYPTSTYRDDISIADAAAASMSLPPFFQPYPLPYNGRETWFFDGEIRNTLNTFVAKEAGADLIIASYSHQPYSFTEEYGSLTKYGLFAIIVQAIYQAIEQKIYAGMIIQNLKEDTFNEVKKFVRENKLSAKVGAELIERVARCMGFVPGLDYIFINPHPEDARMFFEDHFNLSPQSMGNIVRQAYKRTMSVLREYDLD